MKRNYFVFLLLTAVLLFSNCNLQESSGKGMAITGKVENAQDLTAYMDKKNLDSAIQPITSSEVKSNGEFALGFSDGLEPGIYRVRIGSKSADIILNGQEKKIRLTGDINTFQQFDYNIVGSPLSEAYRENIHGLINKTKTQQEVDNVILNGEDAMLSMALVLGTSKPNPQLHAKYASVNEKLKASYPDAAITSQFSNFVGVMKQEFNKQQSKYRVKVGQPAPDIAMADVNGNTQKLSDLKGKVVLLDFWASWCGPCRRANPHVVEMYHKYKDDGFTVFSVSLDGLDNRTKKRFPESQLAAQMEKSKKRWLDAIKKDKLVWDTHVSDLKKWDSQGAALYGVSSIPTTFLIDKEGNIAALNPRRNLEEEIMKNI